MRALTLRSVKSAAGKSAAVYRARRVKRLKLFFLFSFPVAVAAPPDMPVDKMGEECEGFC